MHIRLVSIMVLLFMAMGTSAQTECNDSIVSKERGMTPDVEVPMVMDSTRHMLKPVMPQEMSDAAIKLAIDPNLFENRRGSWEVNTLQGGKLWSPWRGAAVIVSGGANSMPGLLDRESGALTLQQNLGRWTFSTSALADKYRFVGMGFLQTRYGVGGTVSYQASDGLSLHAFGYYYGNSSLISPAVNPYLATNTYGGYADIRIYKNIGVDAGVRRYLNPMTGKWVTDPIINPYIKINGKQKIGFDFGNLLKGLIWGNQDEMMPRGPVRMAPPQQQKR